MLEFLLNKLIKLVVRIIEEIKFPLIGVTDIREKDQNRMQIRSSEKSRAEGLFDFFSRIMSTRRTHNNYFHKGIMHSIFIQCDDITVQNECSSAKPRCNKRT